MAKSEKKILFELRLGLFYQSILLFFFCFLENPFGSTTKWKTWYDSPFVSMIFLSWFFLQWFSNSVFSRFSRNSRRSPIYSWHRSWKSRECTRYGSKRQWTKRWAKIVAPPDTGQRTSKLLFVDLSCDVQCTTGLCYLCLSAPDQASTQLQHVCACSFLWLPSTLLLLLLLSFSLVRHTVRHSPVFTGHTPFTLWYG